MTKAWAWLLCTCTASCIVPSVTAQQQDLSLVGAVADDDTGCSLGYYDHDEDASTACLACPVGKYSRSPAAISRPELDAGAGDLTLSVYNGDSQRLFAMGDPSSNPHPDGGWNYATTNCSFDACIAECTCAADCEQLDNMCNFPPLVYAQPDFAGMNGIRRCGATSQSTVMMVSACNPSSLHTAKLALLRSWCVYHRSQPDYPLVCQGGEPGRGIDGQSQSWNPVFTPEGLYMSSSCVITAVAPGKAAWWQVDLGARSWIERVVLVHQNFRYDIRNNIPLYVSDVDIASHIGDAKEDIFAKGTPVAVFSGDDGPF